MTLTPVADTHGAGVSVASGADRLQTRSQRHEEHRGGLGSRLRGLLSWLVLAVGIVLLWPVAWGGFTGVTIVSGQSMEPTYYTADVVITWKHDSYAVGDVISYIVPEGQPGAGGHVIHRVLEVDANGNYITIGDNNPTADEWEISADDVIGSAVFHLPGAARLLSPEMLPYVVAFATGGIVTVLLWPSRSTEDDEDGQDGQDGQDTDPADPLDTDHPDDRGDGATTEVVKL